MQFKDRLSKILYRLRVWYRWERKMYYLAQKREYEEWLDRGCEYCGEKSMCLECGRCYNRNCNAGCIFCNPIENRIEHCHCCGQEIR